MERITIDFETRSIADLRKTGAWAYSIHPSTEVLCLSYLIPNQKRGLWVPSINHKLPEDLLCALDVFPCIEAHNAFFELCIWENVMIPKHDAPEIQRDRWVCSAAKAASLALPRDLGTLAHALHLPVQKDMEGRRLMLKMTKPRKITKNNSDLWHEEPSDLVRLAQYCETDTVTEEEASKAMLDLSKNERDMFYLDQKINLRGLHVDVPLIETSLEFIEKFSGNLTEKLVDLTGGEVKTAGQRQKIIDYLEKLGLSLPNLQAGTVEDMLGDGGVTGDARKILEIRQALSKSSTKKLVKFIDMVDPKDNRIRGTLLYHGATTGRWSGRGIQPQNFPRGTIKDVDDCIETLSRGDYELFKYLYPDVMGAISSCLRGMICSAPGKDLIAADFSSIESRVLFWLAGEKSGLHIYKTHGKIYEDMAAFIFGKHINEIGKSSMERQLGKAAILGCGYQMGKSKFYDTCLDWGIPVSKQQAAVAVEGFRTRFPNVVKFWYALNNAALKAIHYPGTTTQVGLLKFRMMKGYLFILLPSGRKIAYREPEIRQTETSFGMKDQMAFYGMNSQTRKWERQRTYGGKLAENVVQAVARDFMAESMVRVENASYNIVTTVHDEILCEIPEDFGSIEEFEKLMAINPPWGLDCPIAVEGWRGKRFKK